MIEQHSLCYPLRLHLWIVSDFYFPLHPQFSLYKSFNMVSIDPSSVPASGAHRVTHMVARNAEPIDHACVFFRPYLLIFQLISWSFFFFHLISEGLGSDTLHVHLSVMAVFSQSTRMSSMKKMRLCIRLPTTRPLTVVVTMSPLRMCLGVYSCLTPVSMLFYSRFSSAMMSLR